MIEIFGWFWTSAIVVITVGTIFLVIGIYNNLVGLRQNVNQGVADIDAQLRFRHDLIPNLVETVKGYVAHESGTLETVVRARAEAVAAEGGPDVHTGPEQTLTAGLRQLLAVSEAYPDLKASGRFLDLQRELVTTEDRIQAARRLFNSNVREYNQRVQSFPSLLVAGLFRFAKRDYFEIESSAAAVPSARSTD